jgi:hypothetical protein
VSLYCTMCQHPVDEGLNQCYNCATGFVAQLACVICRRPVPRGSASCTFCTPERSGSSSSSATDTVLSDLVLSPSCSRVPAIPLQGPLARMESIQALPERYEVNRHGVAAEIQLSPNDVAVMRLEIQLIAMLEAYADAANLRTGLDDFSRRNIRACRILAVDLKEEIELIKGPQG